MRKWRLWWFEKQMEVLWSDVWFFGWVVQNTGSVFFHPFLKWVFYTIEVGKDENCDVNIFLSFRTSRVKWKCTSEVLFVGLSFTGLYLLNHKNCRCNIWSPFRKCILAAAKKLRSKYNTGCCGHKFFGRKPSIIFVIRTIYLFLSHIIYEILNLSKGNCFFS